MYNMNEFEGPSKVYLLKLEVHAGGGCLRYLGDDSVKIVEVLMRGGWLLYGQVLQFCLLHQLHHEVELLFRFEVVKSVGDVAEKSELNFLLYVLHDCFLLL